MSFREKIAWISLTSMLIVYVPYFAALLRGEQRGSGGRLVAAILALVVLQVVLATAVAVFAPREAQTPLDERERLIGLRATRVAYAGLATGIALLVCLGAVHRTEYNFDSLLFVLVTTELLRALCQIVQYRREA